MALTRIPFCLLLAALILPRPATAQCGPSVSARFGGETSAVAQLNATNLLVARGTEVEIYNLNNPSAPAPYSPHRRVGLDAPAVKISMTQGSSRAFVLLQNGDVEVLTVSYSPLLSINFPTTIGTNHAVDILADGQRVYVAYLDEDTGFPFGDPHIYSHLDVYDDTSGTPAHIGSADPLPDQYGFDRLAKVGNVVWAGFHGLNSSAFGIDGFDVTNPANPVRTGAALNNASGANYTYITAMTAIGSKLLVSYIHGPDSNPPNQYEDWLRAADVTFPTNPAWLPAVDLNGSAGTMSSVGNQLRISIKDSGVGTWDTTNPAALTWMGAYFDTFPNVGQMVSVSGTDYWAAGRAGLMTMNTTNPASVSTRSTPIVPTPTRPTVVRQRGNTTVVLDYTLNTMRIYDYTLPEAQQLRSSTFLPLGSERIELAELSGGAIQLACVATDYISSSDSVTIYDITNPAAPLYRSTITGFTARIMSASGSRLYVQTYANDLKIIELAQPLAPSIRSTTFLGGPYQDITCMSSWSNNSLAVGTISAGLRLFNTTNATAPVLASTWSPALGYHVNALAKGANYLYISSTVQASPNATPDYRLESLNVTNLAAPTLRFMDNATSGAGDQGWFNSLAYIASPVAKFLVGTREYEDPYEPSLPLLNGITIYELPPGFLTNEGVPFPIAEEPIPLGHGAAAPNADGSKFLIAAGTAGLYQFAMPVNWAPGFGTRPFNQRHCVGDTADFVAFASGNPASVTYQWYRDGVALTDGLTPWGTSITGSTNSVLELTNIHDQDSWINHYSHRRYSCTATNSCGSSPSASGSILACYANCDCSEIVPTLNVNDFACFLNKFASGDPYANCDGSSTPPILNVLDFACFLNAFAAGCP